MSGQITPTKVDLSRAAKLLKSGCTYFNTPHGEPYRTNRTQCGAKPVADGQHGMLCADHRRHHEAYLESQRKQRVIGVPNEGYSDNDIVNNILKVEAEALRTGKVIRVRFGSCAPQFKPDYMHFWEGASPS